MPEDVGKPGHIQRPIFLGQYSILCFQPPFHGCYVILSVAVTDIGHQGFSVEVDAKVPTDNTRFAAQSP
jgi:hypothetical protein